MMIYSLFYEYLIRLNSLLDINIPFIIKNLLFDEKNVYKISDLFVLDVNDIFEL